MLVAENMVKILGIPVLNGQQRGVFRKQIVGISLPGLFFI